MVISIDVGFEKLFKVIFLIVVVELVFLILLWLLMELLLVSGLNIVIVWVVCYFSDFDVIISLIIFVIINFDNGCP